MRPGKAVHRGMQLQLLLQEGNRQGLLRNGMLQEVKAFKTIRHYWLLNDLGVQD